jgi:hypothetical protein
MTDDRTRAPGPEDPAADAAALPPGMPPGGEPPVDLSALRALSLGGHSADASARFAALAARVEAAAAPELARRAARAPARRAPGPRPLRPPLTLAAQLARGVRPALALAAASVLAAVALSRHATADAGADRRAQSPVAQDFVAGQLLADGAGGALGLPSADPEWITQTRAPSREGLREAIGLGEAQ